jgi:putative membrane protein
MFNFDKSSVGLFLGLMAAVCYGFIPLFTKELQAPAVGLPLSSSTILFYRFGIASLILAVIMFVRRESFRITYAEFVRLVQLAFLSNGAALFLISGYRYCSSSGVATTLHFTYPILTALIMMVFFRERSRLSTWIAIGLSIAGVALLSGVGGGAQWLGIVLEIISALCFALYLIRVNRSRVSQMPVVKLTFYVMAFGALIFAAFIAYERADFDISAHYALIPSAPGWLNLCLLSVICTVVTNLALVYATQNVGPTVASILGVLEPLTALILGILFLGEELTPSMAAGIGLILPAVLIIILRRKA